MAQALGFLIGKAILIAPGLVLGWLHAGALWVVVCSALLAAVSTALTPMRPIPKIEGAPRHARASVFMALTAFTAVVNLACYALAYWLSPR